VLSLVTRLLYLTRSPVMPARRPLKRKLEKVPIGATHPLQKFYLYRLPIFAFQNPTKTLSSSQVTFRQYIWDSPMKQKFEEHRKTKVLNIESGGTVVSPRTSHSGGPGSILARGRPPWKGLQWFSFPLQVNTGVVPLRIGHAVYLPPIHPSPSSRYSSITFLFASQSLTTSPFHSDYK